MTATRTAKTRSPSTPALLRYSTLLLVAAVAIEVSGLRALPSAETAPSLVASIDGAAIGAPAAVMRVPAHSVEIRIVAQADLPAR